MPLLGSMMEYDSPSTTAAPTVLRTSTDPRYELAICHPAGTVIDPVPSGNAVAATGVEALAMLGTVIGDRPAIRREAHDRQIGRAHV